MDAAKLFEGIALLIDLAEQGKIDPWDVQVIEVIDRYLSELIATQEAAPASNEANLSQSGQAFLSASMLVLFKANTLIELESLEAAPDTSTEDLVADSEDGGVQTRQRLPLERQLRRRPSALPPPKRRVGLKELIEQLQLMATQLQQQEALALATKNTTPRRPRPQSRAEAARAIAQLAHQENLTEVAAQLEQFLSRQLHLTSTPAQEWLNLDELVELWTKESTTSTEHNHAEGVDSEAKVGSSKTPTASTNGLPSHHTDRVSVFWALLLLSAQSKVELVQEEFYQEIKIRMYRESVDNNCSSNGTGDKGTGS